jgi:hypothetical protein
MRWYVQVEALFRHAHELRVEDAVERHLMEAGAIRPDAESVQGNPGPSIWTGITVEPDALTPQVSSPGRGSPRLWRPQESAPMRMCWKLAGLCHYVGSGGRPMTAISGRPAWTSALAATRGRREMGSISMIFGV